MGLPPGREVGSYTIRSLIGMGGMGEVYLAHDPQLKRDVAIKVLPEQFARDPERLARFRREAQLLASLNHPNIAGIYRLEESNGLCCLVMEYVPGETLAERIRHSGPVPLEDALDIAKQICEALDHAHEKPIIHRDLKPANVKLTPEGKVKVLDFGLAKAFASDNSDPVASPDSNSPTVAPNASPTIPGVILGTAAYMSPEQARGKRVDKRTDIWALGCVLYEMLTGKQAYRGETVTDILAKVLEGGPDWTALPPTTPPGIRTLLRRCLQKDAGKRFHSAADVALEIEETLKAPEPTAPSTIPPVPTPISKAVWRRASPFVLTALAAAAITGGIAVWNRPQPATQPVTRVVVPLPPGEQLTGTYAPMVAISPDGTQLAYVSSGGRESGEMIQSPGGFTVPSRGGLFLRAMDSLEARRISGAEGAIDPFFSPDGQWIGFFARDSKLKKVSTSGGATLNLADVTTSSGATWGPNDTIVYNPSTSESLWQVSTAGGAPQKLTTLKDGESSHRWPQFVTGKNAVLFAVPVGTGLENGNIVVLDLETREQKILIQGGTYPRYAATGYLVYYRAGTIMAVPFDADRLEVRGTSAPVMEGVMPAMNPVTGGGQFSFSNRGSLAYVPGDIQAAELTLVWVDRKGAETPLPAPVRAYDDPRLSPDGQQVVVQITGASNEIWTYDISRSTLTRLTFMEGGNFPFWTADGKRIVYLSQEGTTGLFWKPADGSGAEEALLTGQGGFLGSSASPDGKALAYFQAASNTSDDIWILPLEGERKPKPFLQAPGNQSAPMFSPDGRWIAYVSDESGRSETYVQPYPGPGGKWQISTDGGTQPVWARNGRELFYRNGDRMMAVDVTTQPAFRAGTPQMLFERPGLWAGTQPGPRADFDVSPDGQRFLMLKTKEQPQTALTQIHVVLNWFEELKRRVPTGR